MANLTALQRRDKIFDQDAFTLTTKLLQINPEFYSLFAYRRDIMIKAESTQEDFEKELLFLQERLREFPKCYWIWSHRMWCLQRMTADWKSELQLVNLMLSYDERNCIRPIHTVFLSMTNILVHGWHYRRYVVENLESHPGGLAPEEFEFTTEKIKRNFSNFSAWHNRTLLIPILIRQHRFSSHDLLESELNLVHQAMYTDPDDQSVWIYLLWLLHSSPLIPHEDRQRIIDNEVMVIKSLLEIEPSSKCKHFLSSSTVVLF